MTLRVFSSRTTHIDTEGAIVRREASGNPLRKVRDGAYISRAP